MATKWVCENPECRAEFAEYVNGCPKCYEGNLNAGRFPLYFSVRAVNECRWCKENSPEWSYAAKVWIHRRVRLDRRCENPPNDYGYTTQVPEGTISQEKLRKMRFFADNADANPKWRTPQEVIDSMPEPSPRLEGDPESRTPIPWPDPTPEMLNGDPLFEAIWGCIRKWDINVPDAYCGYSGATGNHVRAIIDAIRKSELAR